ncbi:MAG: hypothetical protein ACRD10_09040, partial [Terriglobia bacterium]
MDPPEPPARVGFIETACKPESHLTFERQSDMFQVALTDHRFPHVEAERRAIEAAGGQLKAGQTMVEDQLVDL